MPGQRVEITYEAIVRGMEHVSELARKNQELGQETEQYKKRVVELTEKQEKHTSAMLKARQGIIAIRREMFAASIVAGTLVAAFRLMASHSDALAERFEKLDDRMHENIRVAGEFWAKVFGGGDSLTRGQSMNLLALQADVLEMRGDQHAALLKRMRAEEIKFRDAIKGLSDDKQRIFLKEFQMRQSLQREQARLGEFGFQTQADNMADLKRGVGGGLQSTTADVIFKALQGEHQTMTEVLKAFQSSLNRSFADFISKSLFTFLFKRFDPVMLEIKRAREALERMEGCVCRLGGGGGGGGRLEGTITPPKKTALDKIGAIAGLVGAVASIGAFAGAAGGGGAPGGDGGFLTPGGREPIITGGFPTGKYGGWTHRLPRYQAGGEIPAILHAGEFVVNRAAAQANKSMLEGMNSGGGRGAGNNFYVSIKANDSQSFDQQLSTPSARARMEMQVIRLIMENADVRRVIRDFAK